MKISSMCTFKPIILAKEPLLPAIEPPDFAPVPDQ
jgi:hypothetical protein